MTRVFTVHAQTGIRDAKRMRPDRGFDDAAHVHSANGTFIPLGPGQRTRRSCAHRPDSVCYATKCARCVCDLIPCRALIGLYPFFETRWPWFGNSVHDQRGNTDVQRSQLYQPTSVTGGETADGVEVAPIVSSTTNISYCMITSRHVSLRLI